MVLLRKVIGDALRARRLAQRRTLRDVSGAANVSLGYLSEIERGHKEASSELLASICDALGAPVSEMLSDVSATLALAEQFAERVETLGTRPMSVAPTASRGAMPAEAAAQSAPLAEVAAQSAAQAEAAAESATPARVTTPARVPTPAGATVAVAAPAGVAPAGVADGAAVTDGKITVRVHAGTPLQATLMITRALPGRRTEPLLVL